MSRRLRKSALAAFIRLPRPVRRTIVHAATPNYTVGAVALIEHDAHFLMLRQTHRVGLSFPGGLVDRYEQPAQGVVREVREETGLHIEVTTPQAVSVSARSRGVDVIFHITCATRPDVSVASEAVGFAWVAKSDVDNVVMDSSTRAIISTYETSLTPRSGRLVTDDIATP